MTLKTLVKFCSTAKSVTEERNLNLRNCPQFGLFRTSTVKWKMLLAHTHTHIPLRGTCNQGKITPSRIGFMESHQGHGIQHHLNPSDTHGQCRWFSDHYNPRDTKNSVFAYTKAAHLEIPRVNSVLGCAGR